MPERPSLARRLQSWLGENRPRWYPAIARLKVIGRGLVAVALLAGLGYAVVRLKPKRGPDLTNEQAAIIVETNSLFCKPREIWIPRSASVFPDRNWLATSHPVQSVSSGEMPVEYKRTETGDLKENYSDAEYEELCPTIMLLVEMGLATSSDESTKYYYIFHEPKTVPRYVKPLGGPGGWVNDVIKMNAVYSLWGHSLVLSLTPSGVAEAQNWTEVLGTSMYDARWFPYDSDTPFASAVSGSTNIRRLYEGGRLVPIGSRKLLEITALTIIGRDRAEIEFTWEWSVTRTGEAFLTGDPKYKALTPLMQRFVSSPGVRMARRMPGLGQSHLELTDGKWQIVDLYLENPG
jgi:hypothetical protein